MKTILLLAVVVALAVFGCDSSTEPDPGDHTPPLPDSLVYFGQTPPGNTPERFAPLELIATDQWFWHGSPAFSPDGREMYWCKYMTGVNELNMQYMEVVGDKWSDTQSVPFNTEHGENNPVFSFDGETVFFVSGRPGGFIFAVCTQHGLQ
jgi:hypothetical protein